MGRLGDVADILTLGLVAGGGYLIYRAWKGAEAALPEIYELELPGGLTIPDIRAREPVVPEWFEPLIAPEEPEALAEWWEMREQRPIGIPGPALRDPSIPSIVDRIADVISFTPLPEPPDYAAGELPIGIPGPAMRDQDRPSIVDRIRDVVVPKEPEAPRPWLQVRR